MKNEDKVKGSHTSSVDEYSQALSKLCKEDKAQLNRIEYKLDLILKVVTL